MDDMRYEGLCDVCGYAVFDNEQYVENDDYGFIHVCCANGDVYTGLGDNQDKLANPSSYGAEAGAPPY